MLSRSILLCSLFLLSTSKLTSAGIGQGDITLWSGNAGTNDAVCTLQWTNLNCPITCEWDFTDAIGDGGCQNDEARSAVINSANAGTIISFYDSPERATNDDYVVITVLEDIVYPNTVLIPSFELSGSPDPRVSMTFYSNNGLDGKVSNMEVRPT